MIIPMGIYAFLVINFSVNIPIWDDYDTVLAYLNMSDSLRYQSFFYQHNEHKIAWTRLVIEEYHRIFGEINFIHLIYLGNLALLFIFFLLSAIFKRQKNSLILLIPVPYLLFQPQAWENITWVTGSLQNFYILLFALSSFYFWNKKTLSGYITASFFGTIATYTSANGLLIFFILITWECREFIKELKSKILLQQGNVPPKKRLPSLLILLGITLLVCYSYLHNYDNVAGNHPYGIKLLSQPLILFKYTAMLLGSYMEPLGNSLIFLMGALEMVLILLLTYKEYDQKNPIIYYFLLFILSSIFITTLGRAGLGAEQALSSRYRSFSVMVLILLYLACTEQYPKVFSSRPVIVCLIFSAMVFNLGSTVIYVKSLADRKKTLEEIITWQRTGKGLNYPNEESASVILRRSMEKGIYLPPKVPTH
jgi:hypothetical protein